MKTTKQILSIILTLVILVSSLTFVLTANAVEPGSDELVTTGANASDFSWDNATVYFLLIDRFNNANTKNDNEYNRGKNQNGTLASIADKSATFQGGDFEGITKKINEGYFTDLGVNALWITAPYEQMHGYVVGGDGKVSFPHYSYHGYYALDYTNTDKNYGSADEFKTLVDTAHNKGIRIVLDVVMNHPGYASIYDMNEYNFGKLNSGWESAYYNFSAISQDKYHPNINYTGPNEDWARWWGKDWLRAGIANYDNVVSGNALKDSAGGGLPDFKTESTASVNVPTFLQNKWSQEGTLSKKITDLNNWFSSTGNTKRVRNYLVYWLSSWVREYGVDGFRCDTAKHVEMDSWKALHDECTKALKEWKTKNPDKKLDDLEFWMTGENYGQGLDYNDYYKSGGFDSMINFSMGGGGGAPGVNNINNTYSDYANKINTNDKFNVLTYISSHDTALARGNSIYQGSAFLLLPGAVQIFYGDESDRALTSSSINDHRVRSFMNWNDLNNSSSSQSKTLAHWQKVGTFRNNHIAVGAGSHTSLSTTSGAAFARTYNKNGISDKVVACIGASSNANVTITLNGTFADGTVLKNTYDNTTATVSGGKVTFKSGINGTILLEEDNVPQPTSTETVPTTDTTPTESSDTTPTDSSDTTPTDSSGTTQTDSSDTTPTDSSSTAPTNTNPTGESYTILLGDANLDGGIDVKDATLVQKYCAELETLGDKNLIAADANEDGEINVKDVTVIQKYCADLETGCRVGQTITVYGPTTPVNTDPIDTPPPDTTPTDTIGTDPTETTPTTPTSTDPPITDPPITEPTITDPPVTDPVSDGTIKFTNSLGWQQVYAYFWVDGVGTVGSEWPGTPMEYYEDNPEGKKNYTINVPAGAQYVIFNNNSGSETQSLPISGTVGFWLDGSQTDGKYNGIAWDTSIEW